MGNRPVTTTDAITVVALGATAYAIGAFFTDRRPKFVFCAGCGTRGQWVDEHTVLNATDVDVSPWCAFNPTNRKRRAHGPWVPETRT